MKRLQFVPENCTGCRYCELVCEFMHTQECGKENSRIKIIKDEEYGNHLAVFCNQCDEAPCINVCPTNALFRDEKTGVVMVDDELCVGCGSCIGECPIGALRLDRYKSKIIKCDLCGGDPECVKKCSRNALILVDVD